MSSQGIGFVGLGKMGNPMVRRLVQAGHTVVAFDLQAEARSRLEGVSGVVFADSLGEVGAKASVVITMLPNGSAVATAALGNDDGGKSDSLAAGMAEGSILIDMSSSGPWETTELGSRLRERGLRLIDAPVSGGVARAVTGELAVFVGGDDVDIDDAIDALEPMSSSIFRTGKLGSGHAAKALNNLLSAACFAATIEVVRIAESWGIDSTVMAEVLNAATGKNNTTERKLRQFVLSESYDSGFALGLMVKDLKQSGALAEMVGVDVPLSRHVIDIWSQGSERLPADADHTELARLLGTSSTPGGGRP